MCSVAAASSDLEVIVERSPDAGITANVAASVKPGIHRVGARHVEGREVDSLVHPYIAMSSYQKLLEHS